MNKKKRFVDLKAAEGRNAYAAVIKKIIKDGVCPFCPKYFLTYHTRPILRSSKHWLVTENMAPYTGADHQYLFILKKHFETVTEISETAWKELLLHLRWLVRTYKLPSGGFFMRFGDARYSGASVAHLHAQLVVGTRRYKNAKPITAFLGFAKKEKPPSR